MVSNKSMGNQFEEEFCEKLGKAGFWVHRMTQSQSGQPADVIAVSRSQPYLIDCKNCVGTSFAKSRIEENQRNSMQLWDECGNGGGWFAVKFFSGIYMAELWMMDAATEQNLSITWFQQNGMTLDEWIGVMA